MNRCPHDGQPRDMGVDGMVYGDAGERIPLPDESVDLLFSYATLAFIDDKLRFFAEAFRVLRPGGSIVVKVQKRMWGSRAPFGLVEFPALAPGLDAGRISAESDSGIELHLCDFLSCFGRLHHDLKVNGRAVILRKRSQSDVLGGGHHAHELLCVVWGGA
eukprot:g2215.t1